MNMRAEDLKVTLLQGGSRLWWDQEEHRMVPAVTIYLPQGCPDWGEKGGKRNNLCTFCALPRAVQDYRNAFYGGKMVPQKDHAVLFKKTLDKVLASFGDAHTLMIFNAGSFLAPEANVPETQEEIMALSASVPSIRRVVIESRAELITIASLERLTKILFPRGKRLTVRIGVETQNDFLRLKVLRKGHSRKILHRAMEVIRECGVQSGGYVLLKPAPSSDLRRATKKEDAGEEEIIRWSIKEAQATLDWILRKGNNSFGMDEAYFCSTNVGRETPIAALWEEGKFHPASLWMVYAVLQYGIKHYGTRVHLLPFRDEPELLAVPSNHVSRGIPQDLSGAEGCDAVFHAMLQRYRETMDINVLIPPLCSCKPKWM